MSLFRTKHSPGWRRSLGLISLIAVLGASSTASAKGGAVRYSYEEVEIAGQRQYVLVPKAERSLNVGNKDLQKSKVIAAFNLLKKKKSTTYGKANIKISGGKWPAKAKIEVSLDFSDKFRVYNPIVIAEVVYTLTEMGVAGVEFPGYSDGPVSRADIPFSVYTLTVPMWQAVPPVAVTPAQVTLADGSTLYADEFYARWKKKDAALVKQYLGFLKSANSNTVVFVMRTLPNLDIDSTDAVLELLAHPRPFVRQEVAATLAKKSGDKKVLGAVAKQLDAEKDKPTAMALAKFLGASKDKSFSVLEPLWLLANAEKEEDAAKAAGALASFKGDARVAPALYAQFSSKRAKVAGAAIAATAKLDDDATQIKALGDDKISTDRQLAIARDLIADKDVASSVAGGKFVASNAAEREAIRALQTLAADKRPEARAAAEAYLTDKTDWRRMAAADALAARKDPESIKAFSAAIKARKADTALEDAGYAVMVAQPLKAILEYSQNKNKITKRLAYRALGERAVKEKAGKKVFKTLQEGAASKDPLIRGACARALGAFASKESAAILTTMASDKSADVRRDIALALVNFKDGTMADVLEGYLDDKTNTVVAAALDSIGDRQEAAAWDKIQKLTDSRDPVIRASALRAIAKLVARSDQQAVTELISRLSGALSAKDLPVRLAAIEALGTFNDENAVLAIAAQLGAKEVDVRVGAIRALGTTGHKSATDLVTNSLDDPNLKIRRASVLACADLKDKSVKKPLEAQLSKEQDAELKELMKQTLRKL